MKVAVIGIGNMGRHHVKDFLRHPDVNEVYVVDSDESRHAALTGDYFGKVLDVVKPHLGKFKGCYTDLSQLLETEDIDAVSIVTPTTTHYDLGKICLEAGTHALIEKPLAKTSEEAQALVDAAGDQVLLAGHIVRYDPVTEALYGLVQSGELGKPISISIARIGVTPPQIVDANVIEDIGIHDIDLMCHFYDSAPTKLWAMGGSTPLTDVIDYAHIGLQFPGQNGLSLNGSIEVNWATPIKVRAVRIIGTKSCAEGNYVTGKVKLLLSLR